MLMSASQRVQPLLREKKWMASTSLPPHLLRLHIANKRHQSHCFTNSESNDISMHSYFFLMENFACSRRHFRYQGKVVLRGPRLPARDASCCS